jgi:hypothetical protein
MFVNKFFAPSTHNNSIYSTLPQLPQITLLNDYVQYSGDSFLLIPFYVVGLVLLAAIVN